MSTQALSSNTAERLQGAHAAHERGDSVELYALVAALRLVGWTLQSIASPLGVSREIVRHWQKHGEAMDLPSVTVEAPVRTVTKATIHAEGVKARREARDLREQTVLTENLPRLLELQPAAEALRGPSAFNPSGAAASAEYTRLIDETVRNGCRIHVLADALGVKPITINARLRRSGLRKTSPSEKVPSWATPGWEKTA